MEKERLTNADIGRELNLPESTVRCYRDRFEDFLPMVGKGRQRRYNPEALDVFRIIAEILRNNGTAEEAQDVKLQNLSNEVRQLKGELAQRETADDARAKERDAALVATMRRLMESQRPQTLWQQMLALRTLNMWVQASKRDVFLN